MIRRELFIFLIVGTVTVLIDFISYRLLAEFEFITTGVAKGTAFLIGTVFAYFANRIWTFNNLAFKSGSALRFAVLYSTTLTANVVINSQILKIFAATSMAVYIAFLGATAVSCSLNYLGMKFFVFKVPVNVGLK